MPGFLLRLGCRGRSADGLQLGQVKPDPLESVQSMPGERDSRIIRPTVDCPRIDSAKNTRLGTSEPLVIIFHESRVYACARMYKDTRDSLCTSLYIVGTLKPQPPHGGPYEMTNTDRAEAYRWQRGGPGKWAFQLTPRQSRRLRKNLRKARG